MPIYECISNCVGQREVPERTDLIGDVVPVVLAAKAFEVLFEQSSHFDDSISHALDLPQPLLVPARVVEDLRRDARTVYWWVRIERSDKDLELRIDPLLLILGLANYRESTDTLAIQTLCTRQRKKCSHGDGRILPCF